MKNNTTELAEKFKIETTNKGYDAGCPGIMSPLGETPVVEYNWFFWANSDKTHRAEQFKQVLNLLENFEKYTTEVFKNEYLNLSIFGRVMMFNIANKQDTDFKNKVLSTISPYAKEGLQENPFVGKSSVHAETIFEKYISPIAVNYSKQSEIISSNNNEVVFVDNPEDENDEELLKAIQESLKISQPENKTNISNNNSSNPAPEITKEILIQMEQILIGNILLSTTYKSSMMNKLNPVIERINYLNEQKFKLGMIEKEAPKIKLLEGNRSDNTIDTDILKFLLDGSNDVELMKVGVLVQVADLYNNEQYGLSGSASDYIDGLIDNLDHTNSTTTISGEVQEVSDL